MSESTDIVSSGPETPDQENVIARIEENVPVTEVEARLASEAVKELLGPDQEIVSVEKKVTVREEEVLMVNGISINLEGKQGHEIKVSKLTLFFLKRVFCDAVTDYLVFKNCVIDKLYFQRD